MMKQTTKRLLVSLAALILSVGAVCTSYAASDKRKVGKMDLVFDSNLGIGVEGSSLSVTAEGANTDRYYISDTDVVNEDSDDFSDSNPPEIEVTLVVADEDQWYFARSSSDAFRLNLAASSKNRYDKVQFVSAKRSEKNAMLTLRVKLIYDKKSKLDNRSAISPVSYTHLPHPLSGSGGGASHYPACLCGSADEQFPVRKQRCGRCSGNSGIRG